METTTKEREREVSTADPLVHLYRGGALGPVARGTKAYCGHVKTTAPGDGRGLPVSCVVCAHLDDRS